MKKNIAIRCITESSKGYGNFTRALTLASNLNRKKFGEQIELTEISKDLYDKGFYIPSGLSLTYQEQEYVASTLLEYVS